MKRCGWNALAFLLALACGELQAAGSWTATAPATRVSLAGRETTSDALRPGNEEARNRTIHSILWRYRLRPGRILNVKLCHPAGCIPLPTMRGTTHALTGMAADVALEFRFSLPEGHHPVMVDELQVIVNHR